MKIINRSEPKINLNDDLFSVVYNYSKGNPGAISALMSILQEDDGFMYLISISELGLKGQYIYMLWNDVCGRDTTKFKDALIMMTREIVSDEISNANLSRGRALPLFDDSIERPVDFSKLSDYYQKQADKFVEKYAKELGLPINGG